MPDASTGRTITQVSIAQGAAGSTDLVAAPGANMKIYVTAIVVALDAAGTVKFTEGTGPTDLCGAMPTGANGGMVVLSNNSEPVLATNTANSKLSLVSATGKAFGWIRYYVA